MEIHLSSDTAIYAMGWYGTCEDEEPFPIASIEDKISGVLQLNEFGSVLDRYDPNKESPACVAIDTQIHQELFPRNQILHQQSFHMPVM